MTNRSPYYFIIAAMLVLVTSCTRLNITNYYHKHHSALDSIEDTYRRAYRNKPFSIEFTDRPFDRVSLELITDTLTYIYEYRVGEPRLQDTLLKFGYDTVPVNWLINRMRTMECTWIDKLDYYVEDQKHSLIYLSLWPRAFNSPFVNKKYYILTYFQQPQYYDSKGRLFASRRRRHLRKINAEVFFRLNDRVFYTISDRFR
ncbi:hypothetical protein [Puia dinghuensis]|uniref:Lipoprotein n=1 Tax=Puia dinghuensis TaxID=1792502 RepID=A0A8J2UH18_9BACT|nr:hypothetical protein [Puia dinghuensis]GGB17137.1 hypothetical protein GCM10011511_46150 [Puia dinghuensis]